MKNSMSDDKKLTLSSKTLGVGKGVETGQVRQNFSHGRGKAVVVERKKKRVLSKTGTPQPATGSKPAGQKPSGQRPGGQKPRKPRGFSPKKPQNDGRVLSSTEQEARVRALEAAKKRSEEQAKEKAAMDARRIVEEAERKKREAAEKVVRDIEEAAAAKAAADAKKKAEEEAVKKAAADAEKKAIDQQAAKDKAQTEAKKKTDLAQRAVQLKKANERPGGGRSGGDNRSGGRPGGGNRPGGGRSDGGRPGGNRPGAGGGAGRPGGGPGGAGARPGAGPRPGGGAARPGADAAPEATKDGDRRVKPKRNVKKGPANGNDRNQRGAARTRPGDDRRKGRLTISSATGGSERQRSLASYKRAQAKKRAAEMGGRKPQERQSREITIPEAISVQDLAQRMAEKGVAVIKVLMGLGIVSTINDTLDQDTAQLVVEELGHTAKRVSEADVEIGLFTTDDNDENMTPRAPIVTVMGHVDHGKTSLLDALRKANVVSGEAGGITQHIGAYQVKTDAGEKLTFLDTPGHAAFTEMRARGASVTDIVILVVAADDSVMPQTIEAINHSKAAGVPMIVAINKMDREGANPDKVRQELLQHEVVTESFSGDTQEVEVSALTGMGLDKLKEAIALQSEILELKANADRAAEGVVVEAKLDKGRGPVATVLVQRGSLKVGDIFVAGAEWGKVRALVNDRGQQVKEAGPSQPVEVLGSNSTPGAGDDFAVVDSEARAREITEYRQDQQRKKKQAALAAPKTLESIFTQLKESDGKQVFDVVIKADVQGSVEAIEQSLIKAGNEDIQCRVIHGAVGGITETDIGLAQASGALVIGFNVRPSTQARRLAEEDGVTIKYYNIIYNLIDDVKAAMCGQLGPEFKEHIVGRANIKDAFQAGKAGKAAGCMVTEGNIRNDLKARILRDDVIIYEGQIDNLRRFKDDVKKVESGQECGLTFENYHDFKSGDVLEVYELEEIERVL